MNNQELIELIDNLSQLPKETEWVEFKTGTATTSEKLGEYISGISNAACIANQAFGYLIFGIDDVSHQILGTNYHFKNKKQGGQELEFWLRQMLSPSIRFEHFVCEYSASINIEVFRIPAAVGEPTAFKNISYIRIGTNLTQLKNYPHLAKAIYNSQEDWSAKVVDKASIADLDVAAVQLARTKFKEKKAGSPIFDIMDTWDDITFLDKARITIGGKITNTAIILLGKPESAHFISPSVAQITWKLDTEEKSYEHFGIPLFITINEVLRRIRNIKYKFFPDNQLFSTEVNKYETKVILEALNNCIAHQDYQQYSRIILSEQINKLIFINAGGFFEGSVEDYTPGDKTPKKYRNKWLADAMVNLNMIDTLGFGIHRMYIEQRKRFFPLPDYTKSSSNEVVLEIYGHTIDENYSKLLIEKKDTLSLTEVILLDKVQKKLPITDDAAILLRKQNLIEGRKPNYYISSSIANIVNQKASYTKNKGLNKEILKTFILQHIKNHGFSTRKEIDELLLDKLPTYLTDKQKKRQVANLLQEMTSISIENKGSRTKPHWIIVNT